jgi:hypothetical protein
MGGGEGRKPYCWQEAGPLYSEFAETVHLAIFFSPREVGIRRRMESFQELLQGSRDACYSFTEVEAARADLAWMQLDRIEEADALVWLGQGLQIVRHGSDLNFDAEKPAKKWAICAKSAKKADIRPVFSGHPVLEGVGPFTAKLDVKRAATFPKDATRLLIGQIAGNIIPVAWARYGRYGRAFGTLLGSAEDFQQPEFVRMALNALAWVRG